VGSDGPTRHLGTPPLTSPSSLIPLDSSSPTTASSPHSRAAPPTARSALAQTSFLRFHE